MFSMIRAAVVVAVTALVLVGVPGLGQAQLVLYDDFKGRLIDPDRWSGNERNTGLIAPNTETSRSISGGKLEILLTNYGRTNSDAGAGGTASSALQHTNPAVVTTLEAAVTVKKVEVQGCAANSTATRARAGLVWALFNDGTSPALGDRTGDVFAGIQSVRDSISGDRIEAFINRCTNATCTTFVTLNFHAFAASWTTGIADTLRMQWDPGNDQVVFTLNPGAPGEESTVLGYGLSDAAPPVVAFAQLQAANSVASCTAGRRRASMTAIFDNVGVNP
jgi:hypothetical protein